MKVRRVRGAAASRCRMRAAQRTAVSPQDAAQRELQHDNVEAAQVHALLAVGVAIERLARAVEDSSKQT